MSYGYGGGRPNPFDQRDGAPQQSGYGAQPYGAAPNYGRQQYGNAPAMGRDEYGNNLELEPLTPNGQYGGQTRDPKRAILDECAALDTAIDEVSRVDLRDIRQLQSSLLNNPDPGASTRQLDKASTDIMQRYRTLVDRIKPLKSKPESRNPSLAPQIDRVDRKLKAAMHEYQKLDAEFRKKLQEQMARQYRIVRPDASEAEVREAVEDTSNQQVFSQALMQSNRRGQAQSALSAVQSRHEEIQKIERQMIELAELFQDMDNLVQQQEVAVTNIEMKGEEVVDHMDKGNEQLGTAIVSARNARKWKWWCLGICVLIVVIIVIVILIYKFVIQNNGTSKSKRFILPIDERDIIFGTLRVPPQARSAAPAGLEWARDGSLAAKRAQNFEA